MSLDAPLIYPALLLLILFALSLFAVDSPAATDGAADTNYFRDSIGGRSGSTWQQTERTTKLSFDGFSGLLRRMSLAQEIPLQTRPPVSRL